MRSGRLLLLGGGVAAAAAILPWAVVQRAGRRSVVTALDRVEPHALALVLGAGVLPDGRPTRMLEDRVEAAAELLRAGRVDQLLLSGDSAREGYDEVGAMVRVARYFGVADDRILEDRFGVSTWASCRNAAARPGARRVVVVTQRFHAPRAAFLSRAAGLEGQTVGLPDLEHYGRRPVLPLMVREVPAAWKAVLDVTRAATCRPRR